MKRKNTIENEHHVYDSKGLNVGLLNIDVTKLEGIDLWAKIDTLLVEYSKVFPNELRMLLIENAAKRQEARTSNAESKDKTMRWGASIPPALYWKLQALEPTIFTDKKLFIKFLNRYKGFRIAKKI